MPESELEMLGQLASEQARADEKWTRHNMLSADTDLDELDSRDEDEEWDGWPYPHFDDWDGPEE